jgi:DNA-binding transcriptional regulator YhcF (GntR family)
MHSDTLDPNRPPQALEHVLQTRLAPPAERQTEHLAQALRTCADQLLTAAEARHGEMPADSGRRPRLERAIQDVRSCLAQTPTSERIHSHTLSLALVISLLLTSLTTTPPAVGKTDEAAHQRVTRAARHLSGGQRRRGEHLAVKLRAAIVEGCLAPGFRFSHVEVQQRHQEPPTIVTYALARLQADGLVEVRPRLGYRVAIPYERWSPPGGVPHAEHIERTLRQRIASGPYRPGLKLPTLDALADEFGVSVSTVRTAMRHLKDDGMVEAHP